MKKDKIAILIPCYNESKTIQKVIKDFKKVLPHSKIYVYDNNSTDKTDELAKKQGAIVRYEYKQGKGNVIKTMLREIDAKCYLIVDGDDTYPADVAKEMCDCILSKKADMVIGDRLSSTYFKQNNRKFHNFGNKFVRFLINKIFKSDIKDIMTGYRAISYRFAKGFPIMSKEYEIETEMTIHAVEKNYKIIEIPVMYRNRIDGSISKLRTFCDGYKILKIIVQLFKEYKPSLFFNIFATLILIMSIIFLIPIFIEYYNTGLVPKFPTLIVSTMLLIMSLLLYVTGIILQTIVNKNKRIYELIMNQMRK